MSGMKTRPTFDHHHVICLRKKDISPVPLPMQKDKILVPAAIVEFWRIRKNQNQANSVDSDKILRKFPPNGS
jgi:hypothetical protein